MFKSLKKEIFAFAFGLTILTVVTTTAVSIFSTQSAGVDAEKATSNILREQSKESLIQIAKSAAEQQDLTFQRIRDTTNNIADYTKNIYENPSIFSNNYWKFDTRVFKKDGAYINATSDISTFHIPSFVTLDPVEKKHIENTANLDFIVPPILKTNENILAIYTIDNKGVTRYYPNIVLGEMAPPTYDPREDVYYKPVTPKEDPEKKLRWSSLYADVVGRGLMITAMAPVYTKSGFEGIVGTDVLLSGIIKNITSYSPVKGSYSFLIDKEGEAIAFPDSAYKDILGRERKQGEVQTNLQKGSSREFAVILKDMMNGSNGFGSIRSGKKELFIAYAPLKQTGFSLAVVVEGAIMLKAVDALHSGILNSIQNTIYFRIVPANLFLLFLISVIGFLLVIQIIKPIRELTLGVREIGKGNLKFRLKTKGVNEIGELASSFNRMSQELSEYSLELETKIKERTRDLEIANEHLRVLDKQKSEFVSIASHQLRTPLTAIIGYSSMILEGTYGSVPEKITEVLQKVFDSSRRLAVIIDDFLTISHIEQGKITYKFETVEMKKMVENLVEDFVPRAQGKNLYIHFTTDGYDIYNVTADAGKIQQILSNLLDNAVKYSLTGGIEVRLTKDFGLRKTRIMIKDMGIGLSRESIAMLFQKFSRAKEVQKVYTDGSGIGLYIGQELIKAHHGRIWVESEGKGKGSSFFIELLSED